MRALFKSFLVPAACSFLLFLCKPAGEKKDIIRTKSYETFLSQDFRDSLTFIVTGDMQIDRNDSLETSMRPVMAMNQVEKTYGKTDNGFFIEGRWPVKTVRDSATGFKQKKIRKPSFVIITGDLTNNSADEELERFAQLYGQWPQAQKNSLVYPVFAGLGNHDIYNVAPYQYLDKVYRRIKHSNFNYQVETRNYSFTVGNYHFIQMNVFSGYHASKDYTWLKKELASNLSKEVFLVQHYGFDDFSLCKDSAWGVPEPDQAPGKCRWYKEKHLKKLISILAVYPVKAIFTGHWHLSGHCQLAAGKNKVPVFTAGGARDSDDFLLISVSTSSFQVSAIRFMGSSDNTKVYFDEFSMGSFAYDSDPRCKFVSTKPYHK